MNKEKLIEELLELEPGVSKEKIDEIVKILMKSNPKVEIDKNFKKNLKNRLKNIGNYEKKSFYSYLFFGVPVLSAICILTFFYYFSDNFFLKNPGEFQIEQNYELRDKSTDIEYLDKNYDDNLEKKIDYHQVQESRLELENENNKIKEIETIENVFKPENYGNQKDIFERVNIEGSIDSVKSINVETLTKDIKLDEAKININDDFFSEDIKLKEVEQDFTKSLSSSSMDEKFIEVRSLKRDSIDFEKFCIENGLDFERKGENSFCKGKTEICEKVDFLEGKCNMLMKIK